ncbi:MAG: cupin domain-containing protein [Nitrospiraceae bacterium]|nr:MAG: cupin domain-containing protein [Nitrospiraceae bacterium]
MSRQRRSSSCDIMRAPEKRPDNRNRLYTSCEDFSWKGVQVEKYKSGGDDWSGIVRQVLIGGRGESAKFHLRYFEIEPGGFSSFETHKHEHVVITVRGRGRAKVKRRIMDLKYLDVLYVNPDSPHRLSNPYEEPFGFFCIVNAKRDRPKIINKKPKD